MWLDLYSVAEIFQTVYRLPSVSMGARGFCPRPSFPAVMVASTCYLGQGWPRRRLPVLPRSWWTLLVGGVRRPA